MNRTAALLTVALVAGLTTQRGNAAPIVLPTTPHVTYNSIPFGPSSGTIRYQQVYDDSLFSGPVNITGIAFSPDTTGTWSGNVIIRFATTTVPVGSLSSNLDLNPSSPLITVFSNPTFSQSVTGGTESFSLQFNFPSSPYFYNPLPGQNLLLDIQVSGVTYSGFGTSRTDGGTQSSRAYNTTVFGNNADNLAQRTQFNLEPAAVPEPATMAVFAGLLGAGGLYVRRRKAA